MTDAVQSPQSSSPDSTQQSSPFGQLIDSGELVHTLAGAKVPAETWCSFAGVVPPLNLPLYVCGRLKQWYATPESLLGVRYREREFVGGCNAVFVYCQPSSIPVACPACGKRTLVQKEAA